VLRWLRGRRGSRRVAVRKISFAVYITVLAGAIYGWPVLRWLAQSLGTSHIRSAAGVAVIRSLPLGLACVFVIVVVGACRNALWRGPVVVSEPDVAWLFPTPLDRGRLLRPRVAAAIGVAAVVGAFGGALGALLINAVHPNVGGRIIVGMIGYGCATAVVAIATAALVEASARVASLVRHAWPYGLGLSLVLAGLTTARAAGRSWIWLDRIALWSGPWGWVAQLPVASDRGSGPVIPAAVALTVSLCVAVAYLALRGISGLSNEALRARSHLGNRMVADLYAGDARSIRLEINDARAVTVRTGLQIRVPRSSRLVIAWRDLIALVRAPGRVAWAAFYVGAATLVVGVAVAVSATHDPAPVALAVGVLAGYFAAAALLEAARLDNDRPEVTAQLPLRFSDIARRHVVVPTAVLAGFGTVATAAAGVRFGASPWACAIAAIAAAPVLVAAALLNTYRNSTPIEWTAADPYGLGITLVVLWLLVGPLVAVIALVVTTAQVFSALRRGSSPASAIGGFVITSTCVTATVLWVVTRRSAARARAAT
jgi:hypothetical protein